MHVARYRGDAGVSVGISVASASQIIGALPFSTFPDGVVLSTGTGLAPDLDVTLKDADVVSIDIEGVGDALKRRAGRRSQLRFPRRGVILMEAGRWGYPPG